MAQGNSNLKFIALAVICVVLVASTVGALALYMPTQDQIKELEETIESLNDQITQLQEDLQDAQDVSEYTSQIASLQAQITQYNTTLTQYKNENNNLQIIVSLSKAGTLYSNNLTQAANINTTLWSDEIDYAGFVVVEATSNVTSTYTEVSFTYSERTFSYNQTLGKSGTAVFPVLPGTMKIIIGNVNEDAKVNVTAVYHY